MLRLMVLVVALGAAHECCVPDVDENGHEKWSIVITDCAPCDAGI